MRLLTFLCFIYQFRGSNSVKTQKKYALNVCVPGNNAVQSNGFIFLKRNEVWTKNQQNSERERASARTREKTSIGRWHREKNETGSKKNRQRRMINTDAEFIFKNSYDNNMLYM